MNVDSQFPPASLVGTPQQPAQRPAEQVSTRPVDQPQRDEATSNQTRQENERVAERPPTDQRTPTDGAERQNSKPATEPTSDETRELEQLKSRDREVRAHEAAHKSAAGSLARGGASFEYKNGSDGQRYAVGGEVSIDVSKASGDPQATIAKADKIRQAALAPAQPSSQDFSVAAGADQLKAEARSELAAQVVQENQEGKDSTATDKAPARGGFDTNPTQPASVGELLDVVA